jgi:TP901 family phage tail tape measure protein
VALVGAGIAAGKLAVDFQSSMDKIQALVGVSAAEVGRLSESVLNLATQVPVAPKELADALFFIESAGQHGATALNTLKLSAQAAAAGLGSTATVADAVTSAMNAYASSGLSAASATDIMIAAVRLGKLPPQDLAASLGQVLPVAASLGVSFGEVAGAIAATTREGLTAARGATGVRFLLSSFTKPSAAAVTALKDVGISLQGLQKSLDQRGLQATLETLAQKFDLSTAAGKQLFATVVGGTRGLSVASILVGQNLADVQKVIDGTTHATGNLAKALEAASHTAGFQMKQAFADLQVTLIRIGDAALPAITQGAAAFAGALTSLAPLLKIAVSQARALFLGFIAFKVMGFLPDLFLKAGASLLQFGRAGQIAGKASIGLGTSMSTLGGLAVGVTAGVALLSAGMQDYAQQAALNAATTKTWAAALADGTISIDLLKANIAAATQGMPSWATAITAAALAAAQHGAALITLNDNFKASAISIADFKTQGHDLGLTNQQIGATIAEVNKQLAQTPKDLSALPFHFNKAGVAIANFMNLSNKDLKAYRATTITAFSDVAGAVDATGAVYTLTAAKALAGVQRMAAAQQRMVEDLKKLDTIHIGDKLKADLLNLGPQMVDAFVHGNAPTRGKIVDALKSYDTSTHDMVNSVRAITTVGGQQAGKALPDGMVKGIAAGTGAAVAAAANLGRNVVAALRASMGVHSPSTEGIKVGEALMDGLMAGMQNRFSTLEGLLKSLIPLISKALGVGATDQAKAFLSSLNELDKQFAKLQQKISTFQTAIRGAFSGLADFMSPIGKALSDFTAAQAQFTKDQAAFVLATDQGQTGLTAPTAPTAPDLHALIAAQVAQASQLAALLKQLQKQGLSTANLTSIAGQAPASAIAEAQALLQDPALIKQLNEAQQQIADITQTTVNKLTNAAFGDQVQRLSDQFARLVEKLGLFIAGIDPGALTSKTKAFIDALEQMTDAIARVAGQLPNAGPPNQGGSGGGGGWGQGGFPHIAIQNLNVNVPAGADAALTAREIRDKLLELGRANNGTGL